MSQLKQTTFLHGLVTFVLLAVIMLFSIVVCGADPQIPLVLGCAIAGIVATTVGYSWDSILSSMVKGISQSIEAVLILMCIGVLVSVWIAAGTVPTIIYFGLKFVHPSFFLVVTFLLCSVVSMIVGAWGAAGSVGLAFMGIGQAMGVDAPIIAGAIVAGSYVGDKISPFSDSTNLAATVAKCNVFDMVKQMLPICGLTYFATAAVYTVIGLRSYSFSSVQIEESIQPMTVALSEYFFVNPIALLPLAVMLICIMRKMPAIPAVFCGALVGAIQAVCVQQCSVTQLLEFTTSGYVSETGLDLLDNLLSTGGILSMMRVISIIVIAMAFGGIMQGTGQTAAVIAPITRKIQTDTGLSVLTIGSCIVFNALLPDQYLGIMVPGQMFAGEYQKRGIESKTFGNVLGAGASVTSPLIPWNTCGTFIYTVLGVSALQYAPFAFFNYLLPLAMVLYIFLKEQYFGKRFNKQENTQ